MQTTLSYPQFTPRPAAPTPKPDKAAAAKTLDKKKAAFLKYKKKKPVPPTQDADGDEAMPTPHMPVSTFGARRP
jgi:hypothetical protein